MKTPLIPTTHTTPNSTTTKGLISWPLVISLLAFSMGGVALFKASGGTLDIFQLELNSVPVQLQVERPLGAVPPPTRLDIAALFLEARKLEVGIELGVQLGSYALHNLQNWPSCKRYYLVDIWRQQQNYNDSANVATQIQEGFLASAKSHLKDFASKTVFLRNYTTDAITLIKEQVDFIYVDARHDYCGAKQDMDLYYPLLKSGGIMAGHDYIDAPTVMKLTGMDWALCMDGSRHEGAVKGAVHDFAMEQGLTVMATYEDGPFVSWLAIKP